MLLAVKKTKMKKILVFFVCISILLPIFGVIFFLIVHKDPCFCCFIECGMFFNVLSVIVGIGSISAMLLVNKTLLDHNDAENIIKIKSDYRLAKTKILYEKFEKFRGDWQKTYVNYQNASGENEKQFEDWNKVFDMFIYEMSILHPKFKKLSIVKWWNDEFYRVKNIYVTSPSFDANKASINWFPKIDELMGDLVNTIFEIDAGANS